jgi:predicted lipoprotein
MSKSRPTFKSRLTLWGSLLAGACILFYFLPPFHIKPLKASREKSESSSFEASTFVEEFWNEQLVKVADQAVDADEFLAALGKDRKDAVERYGHRLGLSAQSSFLISGAGKITRVEKRSVEIKLLNGQGVVVIETGPVFGNSIRDGSGLLDVSDFSNSQDFNAISSEFNQRVEDQVLPMLKEKAAVGLEVHFVGGVDVTDSDNPVTQLNLTPMIIDFP